MIVGLSGYARSGKDSTADILVAEFGFRKIAFADKLRMALYALDPMVSASTWHDSMSTSPIYLRDVIDEYGWGGYKDSPYGTEIRRLLQRMGTEAGRDIHGQNVWVNALFHTVQPDENIVIPDVRFLNEAEGIVSRGGTVWRITREGVGPANDHISETALDSWSGFTKFIDNRGSLEDYRDHIRELMIAHYPGL